MTKDQSESLTLDPEMDDVTLNAEKKSQDLETANGDDPRFLNRPQKADNPKTSQKSSSVLEKVQDNHMGLENDLEAREAKLRVIEKISEEVLDGDKGLVNDKNLGIERQLEIDKDLEIDKILEAMVCSGELEREDETFGDKENPGCSGEGMKKRVLREERVVRKDLIKEDFNKDGRNKENVGKVGTSKESLNKVGLSKESLDKESLDKEGLGKKGLDKEGLDKGRSKESPKKEDPNKVGPNQEVVNKESTSKKGPIDENRNKKGASNEGSEKEGPLKDDLSKDDQYTGCLNKEGRNREGTSNDRSNKEDPKKIDSNKESLHKEGPSKEGLQKEDPNKENLKQGGLHKDSLSKESLNKEGLNKESLDKDSRNKEGLNKCSLDKEGFNKEGLNKKSLDKGLNKEGLNKKSLDKEGFNKEGLNKESVDKEGRNKESPKKEGPNKLGPNQEGINKESTSKEGPNKEDLKEGLSKESLNKGGLSKDSLDKDGRNKESLNKDGPNQEGINKESTSKGGSNKENMIKECASEEGPNKENMIKKSASKEGPKKESTSKEGVSKEGSSREGSNKESPNQEEPNKVGPSQETPNKVGPSQETPSKVGPNQEAPVKEGLIRKIPNKQYSSDPKLDIEKNPVNEGSIKGRKEHQAKMEEVLEREVISEDAALMNIPEHDENSGGQEVESESLEATAKRKEERETFKVDEPKFEVGIVGEPTAVTELINDDELRAESALPTVRQDHVAQWVANSSKVDDRFSDTEMESLEKLPERRVRRRPEIYSRKRRHIVNHIIKRSIKCLNKMHAMDESGANGKKVEAAEKKEEEDSSRKSPQVPQSQQNGAALPEETAAVVASANCLHSTIVKEEPYPEATSDPKKKPPTDLAALPKQSEGSRAFRPEERGARKRRSTEEVPASNGDSNPNPKKICIEQRDQLVSSLITGYENASADELATKADVLRAELHALDELARAAEMEWNRVLTMRKLKEEAFMRIERRRQVLNFMEGHDRLSDMLPPSSLIMELASNVQIKDKCAFPARDEHGDQGAQDLAMYKNDKIAKSQAAQISANRLQGDSKKLDAAAENRQIGEGRQGPIVDVRSIIADYRLRHPETVPRRGRRMRNSVNVGLGAGGAMVETSQNADSRPSSTDSCKSNSNTDANNSMSFKDVLVQFAKLSQQQGEPVKTPQNYPDVTLHPVAASPTAPNPAPQQTGSLLHGILTKAQSPRPTTFSPTLARLLTAPERERNVTGTTVTPHPNPAAAQRMLQTYQEPNPVSISDLLSSSKGRTEITITPVVNPPVQSHMNNMLHVDDDEDVALMDERESRISGGNRDDRDISPRCQGCHERAAQYVCAGCGNQWYCSPECQALAWDEHSEICSG